MYKWKLKAVFLQIKRKARLMRPASSLNAHPSLHVSLKHCEAPPSQADPATASDLHDTRFAKRSESVANTIMTRPAQGKTSVTSGPRAFLSPQAWRSASTPMENTLPPEAGASPHRSDPSKPHREAWTRAHNRTTWSLNRLRPPKVDAGKPRDRPHALRNGLPPPGTRSYRVCGRRSLAQAIGSAANFSSRVRVAISR